MTAIMANLRKHEQRIRSECGWMSGGPPEIVYDLKTAADHIENLERLLIEANQKAREAA